MRPSCVYSIGLDINPDPPGFTTRRPQPDVKAPATFSIHQRTKKQHSSQSSIAMHLPADVARSATNLTTPHRGVNGPPATSAISPSDHSELKHAGPRA